MALANRTNFASAATRLADWLAARLPGAHDVELHDLKTPSESGLSTETILFDASWRGRDGQVRRSFALRLSPTDAAVFPSYDLPTEYQVMKVLREQTSIAVPAVRWLETDASVLGSSFIVMDCVDGRVPPDDPPFTLGSWVTKLAPAEQATLYDNSFRTLCAIHSTDWSDIGLAWLGDLSSCGLEGQIRYWRDYLMWAAGDSSYPTVEAALEWIEQNRPPDPSAPVLNWGDARIGNMIFAKDLTVAAVLDWEMVTLAAPELDLGWWLFLLRYQTEGVGATLPEGFPPRAQALAKYESLTGHNVEHLDYYEVFAATRLSMIMVRAARLMIDAGMLPPDSPMGVSNPVSHLLARLLDLPVPAEDVHNFVGRRECSF
jgi:aminoglycoside phosphotransferase (APT) family kinase protein